MGGPPEPGPAPWTKDGRDHLPLRLVQETGTELWSRRVPIKTPVVPQLNKITKP